MARIEEIKKNQEIRIAETEALLKAWKAVTFPTKKDGTPFASMAKNFNGAKYQKKEYTLHCDENELKVTTNYKYNGRNFYTSDSVNTYELVKHLKDKEMKAKTENYMPKITYLEQIYNYDIDDCKKAIAQRIDYLERTLETYKKQLETLVSAYGIFEKEFTDALKNLATNTFKEENCYLYSDILDAFKKSYY